MLLRPIRPPLDSEASPVWMRDLLRESSLSLAAAELWPLAGLRRLNAFFREEAMFAMCLMAASVGKVRTFSESCLYGGVGEAVPNKPFFI